MLALLGFFAALVAWNDASMLASLRFLDTASYVKADTVLFLIHCLSLSVFAFDA